MLGLFEGKLDAYRHRDTGEIKFFASGSPTPFPLRRGEDSVSLWDRSPGHDVVVVGDDGELDKFLNQVMGPQSNNDEYH